MMTYERSKNAQDNIPQFQPETKTHERILIKLYRQKCDFIN